METCSAKESEDARKQISGFVLAGGLSSRMGSNKAMLQWNGASANVETLLDHSLRRLRQVCTTVKICVARPVEAKEVANNLMPYGGVGLVPHISDAIPGAGPLGGIVAALEQSETDWNLFLAVDLPLIPVDFLHELLARIPPENRSPSHPRTSGIHGPLCIVPQLQGFPQPLCSVLHRSLAPGLRRALAEGKYKVMLALRGAVADIVSPDATCSGGLALWEVHEFATAENDSAGLQPEEWFFNVNTAQDWEEVQALAARKTSGKP